MKRLLQVFFLTLLLSVGVEGWCQKPTYFDSIISAQINKPSMKKTVPPSAQQDKVPDQNAVVARATEMPPKELPQGAKYPAVMWYGNHFSTSRVRERNVPFDSIPDEINMRLVKSDNDFCFPLKSGVRTSAYGWRARWNRPHRGVDINLNVGDPVYCVFPGVVRVATAMGGYGNVIVVRHYNGLETVYGHLSKIKVKPHQEVQAGTVIGLGGNTGHSTGPHLHFECRFMYESFDPEWIIDIEHRSLRTHTLHLDKTYFGVTAPRGRRAQDFKADKSYVAERKPRDPNKPIYYTTQYGDTYKRLADRYHITVDELMAMNPDAPKKIREGVRLMVRKGANAGSSAF